MRCGWNDCFTCPYPDCILGEDGRKIKTAKKDKRDRKAYQHEQYLKRKAAKQAAQKGDAK